MQASDYRRFQIGLHAANHGAPVVIRHITKRYREPFSEFKADKSLVDVLAYTLMPNHFHLVLRQKAESGITRFMKKVAVAYSMYFNLVYEHSGTLFQGPFKSAHLDSEPYFRWIFSYVHLNPVALVEPKWESEGIGDPGAVREFMRLYRYSSYMDYAGASRPEKEILADADIPDFLHGQNDLESMLAAYSENSSLFRGFNQTTRPGLPA